MQGARQHEHLIYTVMTRVSVSPHSSLCFSLYLPNVATLKTNTEHAQPHGSQTCPYTTLRGAQVLPSCPHNQVTWKLCPKGSPTLPCSGQSISSSNTEGVFQSSGKFSSLFVQFCFLWGFVLKEELTWGVIVFFGFETRVSLHNPGLPGAHYVDQATLDSRNPCLRLCLSSAVIKGVASMPSCFGFRS